MKGQNLIRNTFRTLNQNFGLRSFSLNGLCLKQPQTRQNFALRIGAQKLSCFGKESVSLCGFVAITPISSIPSSVIYPSFTVVQKRFFKTSTVFCQSVDVEKDDNQKKEQSQIGSKRENILTIPNLLSLSRLIAAPFIGYFVINGNFNYALMGFIFAGITDLLDGYIARKFDQRTVFGTVLDPMADKLLMTIVTISLAVADILPVPLATLIVGRDAGLILSGFYLRYISLPPPFTFKRYFDIKMPTAELHPSTLSKVNTALQLSLMGTLISVPLLGITAHPLLSAFEALVATTTFSSGLSYLLFAKKYVVILKDGQSTSSDTPKN